MSLDELLPDVLFLSRSDKLRLIQKLAEDLVRSEYAPSKGINEGTAEIEEQDAESREDERAQEAVHAVGLHNGVGRLEEESAMNDPGKIDIADSDRKLVSQIEVGRLIPIRFPDESYEAAAALMKLLEAEKSAK
jgi:hypothetical protein